MQAVDAARAAAVRTVVAAPVAAPVAEPGSGGAEHQAVGAGGIDQRQIDAHIGQETLRFARQEFINGLEDAANLPAPEVIAREIMENLESALTEFSAIVEALEAGK